MKIFLLTLFHLLNLKEPAIAKEDKNLEENENLNQKDNGQTEIDQKDLADKEQLENLEKSNSVKKIADDIINPKKKQTQKEIAVEKKIVKNQTRFSPKRPFEMVIEALPPEQKTDHGSEKKGEKETDKKSDISENEIGNKGSEKIEEKNEKEMDKKSDISKNEIENEGNEKIEEKNEKEMDKKSDISKNEIRNEGKEKLKEKSLEEIQNTSNEKEELDETKNDTSNTENHDKNNSNKTKDKKLEEKKKDDDISKENVNLDKSKDEKLKNSKKDQNNFSVNKELRYKCKIKDYSKKDKKTEIKIVGPNEIEELFKNAKVREKELSNVAAFYAKAIINSEGYKDKDSYLKNIKWKLDVYNSLKVTYTVDGKLIIVGKRGGKEKTLFDNEISPESGDNLSNIFLGSIKNDDDRKENKKITNK